ncbi:mkk-4 [Pristionchus pacificus]|uniref:mitogen-activated protein kinase kinase n=1 Tax=Pristionchus pacificus TaxID=54126 RepID=A0A2A6CQ62_PRIPA|nr:mkk-4 [Pristionchus pacificus]|eukprot:PDM80171.1 mkk-4 [Pristionchus pacificus]
MGDERPGINRPSGLSFNFGQLNVNESKPSSSQPSSSLSLPPLDIQRPKLSIDGSSTAPPVMTPRTPKDLHVGRLKFPGDDGEYHITARDLEEDSQIGRGNYGTVHKMIHRQTSREMAVKKIRSLTTNKKEQKRLLVELETVMNAQPCENIIRFFGALFNEGDCWLCMELMDTSLDKLYKKAYDLGCPFSEAFVGHITVCTVSALSYLKDELNIMHRDVKPSNIVMNRHGAVKLVDFGIAGELVNSVATSHVGCKPYMAPERLVQMTNHQIYDVRSDVWSLGITLVEISTGHYPYSNWGSIFEQLAEVIEGPAPVLTKEKVPADYTISYLHFVNLCLEKEVDHRPKYHTLMEHAFYKKYESASKQPDTLRDFGDFVKRIIDKIEKNEDNR